MNLYTEILENGQEHLKFLRREAHVLSLQPKQPLIRHRWAKILKNLAAQLEQEPQLAHS